MITQDSRRLPRLPWTKVGTSMIINPLTVLTLYVLPFSEGKGPTSQVQRGIANGVVLFKEVGDWVQTIFLNFSKKPYLGLLGSLHWNFHVIIILDHLVSFQMHL